MLVVPIYMPVDSITAQEEEEGEEEEDDDDEEEEGEEEQDRAGRARADKGRSVNAVKGGKAGCDTSHVSWMAAMERCSNWHPRPVQQPTVQATSQ
jgi:hypothetical protein